MIEELSNPSQPQQSTQLAPQIDSFKQFSNPVCEHTFVALPKIYGLKRGTKRNYLKRTHYNERSARPCCLKHNEEHQHDHPNIQQLLIKHIKPTMARSSVNRLNSIMYNSLQRKGTDERIDSHEKSFRNLSTKRKAVQLDNSVTSMRDLYNKSDMNSIRNDRFKLKRLDRPLNSMKLAPMDHELSHKIFKRPLAPINVETSEASDNEIEINLKHLQTQRRNTQNDQQSRQKILIDEECSPKNAQDESNQSETSSKLRLQVNAQDNKIERCDTTYHYQIEEEEEYEQQRNIDVCRKKLKRKNISVQISETKQIGIGTQNENPRLRRAEMSISPDANTYFVELLKKEPFQKLRYSRCKSLKSSTTVQKFSVPSKQEIPGYIQKYKPMDIGFNLQELVKSPLFSVIPYRNALYIGEFDNGQRQGRGVFIGERFLYEGEFKNGLKSRGTQSTIDGIYKGSYANGYREGHGEFRWFNNQVYIGEWKKGLKHGAGIWKSHNGNYYNGNWVQNRQQGVGIHMHQGSIYNGQFKNFLKHGKGEQKFANGDTYIGQYSEGRCNGFGEYIWKNGTMYRGDFKDGMKHGGGILSDAQTIYEGLFQQDQKEGQGEITYKDGSKLKGLFHKNELVQGQLKYINGQTVQIGNI